MLFLKLASCFLNSENERRLQTPVESLLSPSFIIYPSLSYLYFTHTPITRRDSEKRIIREVFRIRNKQLPLTRHALFFPAFVLVSKNQKLCSPSQQTGDGTLVQIHVSVTSKKKH